MKLNTVFDVIIIGGSYAGLQAAMTLGRALRNVLVIDDGKPCNRQTPHSHNFLTRDGETPAQLNTIARNQLKAYDTVTLLRERANDAIEQDEGFVVTTQAGQTFVTNKLIFATGIRDLIPDIIGFADCWGISVIHCPYCHGYEVRNQPTGLMSKGADAFEFAKVISNWTNDLTIFSNGPHELTDEQLKEMNLKGIKVVTRMIAEIIHDEGYIDHLKFDNGDRAMIKALYARLPFEQHSDLPQKLGCEFTEGGFIKTDQFGKTTVDGIYAAGDNSSGMRAVANAVAMGMASAAMVNKELIAEGK